MAIGSVKHDRMKAFSMVPPIAISNLLRVTIQVFQFRTLLPYLLFGAMSTKALDGTGSASSLGPSGGASSTSSLASTSSKDERSEIEQFMDEEEDYLHGLTVVNDTLLKSLLDEGKTTYGIPKKQVEDMRPFLMNIRGIQITHDTISKEIQAARTQHAQHEEQLLQAVADIMLKFMHAFRVYLLLHKDFDANFAIINDIYKKKGKLTKFVTTVKDQHGVDIMDTLFSMGMRIPQVHISFQHILEANPKLKHGPEILQGLSHLAAALITVRKGSANETSNLFEVHKRIKNSPFKHVMQPGRRLLSEGLNILPTGEQQIYVLFNDLIIWTNKDFEYAGHLYLNKCEMKSTLISKKTTDGRFFFKLVPKAAPNPHSMKLPTESHSRSPSTPTDVATRTRGDTLSASTSGRPRASSSFQRGPVAPDEHSGVSDCQFTWMCDSREDFDSKSKEMQTLLAAASQNRNYKRESMIIKGYVRTQRGVAVKNSTSLASAGTVGQSNASRGGVAAKIFRQSESRNEAAAGKDMRVKLRKTEHPREPFSAHNKILAEYLPRILIERLVRQDSVHVIEEDSTLLTDEFEEQVLQHASVLVADVSGFTKLNEKLRLKLGDKGAEQVMQHLNAYFTQLLDVVIAHGGDCIKFAGDALICIFAQEALLKQRKQDMEEGKLPQTVLEEEKEGKGNDIPSTARDTLRAAQCGLELQQKAGSYEAEGVTLIIHCAVATGTVYAWHLGGYASEWEFLIAGEPFAQLEAGVDLSSQGEVVISKEANAQISKYVKTSSLKAKGAKGGELLLESVTKSLPKEPLAPLPSHLHLNVLFEAAQRMFLTRTVLDKLDAEQTVWLAELRRATVVFLNLTGLALIKTLKPGTVRQVHEVLFAMQAVVSQNQGYRRQFLADDKGTVLIVVFGVPPFAHEDDAFRATKMALELSFLLAERKLAHGIGIASGEVFAGSVGAPYRQEHAVVGDTVNLSARLAGKAAKSGSRGLLLDELTHSKVMHNIKMKSAGEIKVKGKDLTIPVFAPAEHVYLEDLFQKRVRRIGESIQRQEEIAILKSKLVQTMEGAAGGSIVHLTGDAGIGKTQIMHDFEAAALTQFKDLTVCLLTADPTKTDLALGRDLLESLTGIRSQKREQTLKSSKKLDAEIKQRTKLVNKFLEKVFTKDQKEQKERLPLLNRLLSTEMAETPWSLKFTEDPTNEIRDIILQVVQGMLQQNLTVKKPNALVLLVDDAHLLDEESAVLLQGIAKLVGTGQLFLVATSRGDSSKGPGWADTLSALKAGQGYVEKAMVPLSEQEAEKMLCQYFRVDKVPPEVLQLVHSRAKGNPLFVEEVAAAMERSELASTKDNTLVLNASKMQEVDKLLPASLGSLVTKRIDSLDPAIQLLAKLASVFQDEFDGDVFRKLCAREQKRQLTEDHKKGTQRKADQIQQVRDNAMATERGLDVLKAKEILATRSCTVRVNGQPQYKQLFFFLQPEVMHQAYKMLLYSQRFLLHYQIADIIEEVDPENQELIRFHIDKALEAGGKQKDLTKEAKEKLIQKANKFKSKRIEKLVQNMEKTN
eukprot:g72044.t1